MFLLTALHLAVTQSVQILGPLIHHCASLKSVDSAYVMKR